MTIVEQPKLTQWSYSTWKEWSQCPFKTFLKKIKRLREPGSPQMDRGTAIHKLAEDFVTGALDELPNELSIFSKQFTALRASAAMVEQDWGFTRAWQPTGFNALDAWLRVKTDVLHQTSHNTATIIDHKTGRIYDDHKDQLNLYATCGFIMLPRVQVITVQDWYLEQDAMTELVYEREQLPALKQLWEERVTPMLNDSIFPCRPGPHCRYCHFRKSNAGPCSF